MASGASGLGMGYTGQEQAVGLGGLQDYGARWYDPVISQFNQPDSIIPDPYNPLDWNRYLYARYDPIRYNDPDGHRICETVDGNGNCTGKPPKLDTVEKLTKKGKRLYRMYVALNNKSGWWNGGRQGAMTPEQFWGVWILWERSGNPGLQEGLMEAVKNQLWMDAPDILKRETYCQGEECFFGVFNFMGVYGGGHNDLRYTGNYEPQKVRAEGESSINDLMAKTGEVGTYISTYEATRVTYNPNVAFHWGNSESMHRRVKDADIGIYPGQIYGKVWPDFVMYTIGQWAYWFR